MDHHVSSRVHRVQVHTTYADLQVKDRVRAGGPGHAVVKEIRHRDGKVLVLLGKPGWIAGRLATADPTDKVTVWRPDTYILRVTSDGVQVLDLTDPKSEFEPDTAEIRVADREEPFKIVVLARYATVCTKHSTIVHHSSLDTAVKFAASPADWCEEHTS